MESKEKETYMKLVSEKDVKVLSALPFLPFIFPINFLMALYSELPMFENIGFVALSSFEAVIASQPDTWRIACRELVPHRHTQMLLGYVNAGNSVSIV